MKPDYLDSTIITNIQEWQKVSKEDYSDLLAASTPKGQQSQTEAIDMNFMLASLEKIEEENEKQGLCCNTCCVP